MFERKLIGEPPMTWAVREFRPRGVVVMTSGSPSSRKTVLSHLITPNQSGSVHALVDTTGITQTSPLLQPALGDKPNEVDGFLKIIVCEPADADPEKVQELTTQTVQNLAMTIVYLCRYHKMDPSKAMIRFVGKASDGYIDMPECKCTKRRRHTAHSLPFFARSQDARAMDGCYAEDLVKAEVARLQVEVAKLVEENTTTGVERPVDAIGVDDVVLFTGGALYRTRSASAATTSTTEQQLGVVRRVYPQSKHRYEVAFPSGIWYVNKSSLRKSPLGHVVI